MPPSTTAEFVRQSVARNHCNQKYKVQLIQNEQTRHKIITDKFNNLRKNVAIIERKLRDGDAEIALTQNKSNEAMNKCFWKMNSKTQ